jgi:hypothetical protein
MQDDKNILYVTCCTPIFNKLLEGDSRYVLVKQSDPGREIILTTQLYDMPEKD